MQKIILDTIEQQRKIFFQANTFDELAERCEKFLKQALTNAFEAGQKSREKELKKQIRLWGKMLKGGTNEWLVDDLLESLSLTKESK
jgi:DNA-binding ferritin-like protein